MISTYFARSSDDSQTRKRSRRNSDQNSKFHSKKSVRTDDLYYDDDTGNEIINIVQEKVTSRLTSTVPSYHDVDAVAPVVYDRAEHEIRQEHAVELKDRNVQDQVEKKVVDWEMDTAPKSSVFHQRKPTPRHPALEFTRMSKKKLTPTSDYAKQPPGNGYYVVISLSVCLTGLFSQL